MIIISPLCIIWLLIFHHCYIRPESPIFYCLLPSGSFWTQYNCLGRDTKENSQSASLPLWSSCQRVGLWGAGGGSPPHLGYSPVSARTGRDWMGPPPSPTGSSQDPTRQPCWTRGRSIRPPLLPAWAQVCLAHPAGKGGGWVRVVTGGQRPSLP